MPDDNGSSLFSSCRPPFFLSTSNASVGDVTTNAGIIRFFVARKGNSREQLRELFLLLRIRFRTHAESIPLRVLALLLVLAEGDLSVDFAGEVESDLNGDKKRRAAEHKRRNASEPLDD